MFSLLENYKKLFLMCVKNNFEGEAGAYEMKQKVNELKELGENGIEENKGELKDVKKILQEILDYSKTSDKIAKEQLEEIINFLENQINNLVHKEQTSQVLMDDSFSEYNKQSLDFFYSSKFKFEALKEKYFSEKQEVTQNTKQETEELYPEIEAEKNNNIPEGFVINSDGYVIKMPADFEGDNETGIFINTNTQEEYKLENGKIVKISGGKENNKETITPLEKDEVKVEENTKKQQESKENINYSLEEAKRFYEKVGATEDNIIFIQSELKDRGFLGDNDLDGKFGPKTFKAIIEFQKENGLVPDGKVGNNTLKKIFEPSTTVENFYGEKEERIKIDDLDKKLSENLYGEEARDGKVDVETPVTDSVVKENLKGKVNGFRTLEEQKANVEVEKKMGELAEYFGIPEEKIIELKETLDKNGLKDLDVLNLLSGYKDFIEKHLEGKLVGKDPDGNLYIDKIKKSIGIKISNLGNIIEELKKQEIEEYGNLDNFKDNKWILDGKVRELGINNLLLSADFYAKNNLKDGYGKAKNVVNRAGYTKGKIEEIEEMLNAEIDEETGEFDEGIFSTQDILDSNKDVALLNGKDKELMDISLLNEKDREKLKKNMAIFMAFVLMIAGSELALDAAFFPAGAIEGVTYNLTDLLNHDEDIALSALKKMGAIEKDFRMEKTFIDNLFSVIGMIPGLNAAAKEAKILKLASKYGIKFSEVRKMAQEMKGIKEGKIMKKQVGLSGKEDWTNLESNIEKYIEKNNDKVDKLEEVRSELIRKLNKEQFGTEKSKKLINAINKINEQIDKRINNISNFETKLQDLAKIMKDVPDNLKALFNKNILLPFSKIKDFSGEQITKLIENIDKFKAKLGDGKEGLIKVLDDVKFYLYERKNFLDFKKYEHLIIKPDNIEIEKELLKNPNKYPTDINILKEGIKIFEKNYKDLSKIDPKIYDVLTGVMPSGSFIGKDIPIIKKQLGDNDNFLIIDTISAAGKDLVEVINLKATKKVIEQNKDIFKGISELNIKSFLKDYFKTGLFLGTDVLSEQSLIAKKQYGLLSGFPRNSVDKGMEIGWGKIPKKIFIEVSNINLIKDNTKRIERLNKILEENKDILSIPMINFIKEQVNHNYKLGAIIIGKDDFITRKNLLNFKKYKLSSNNNIEEIKKNSELGNIEKAVNNTEYTGMRAAKIDIEGFTNKLQDLAKIMKDVPDNLKALFNKNILLPFSKIKDFSGEQITKLIENIDKFKAKLGDGKDVLKSKLDDLKDYLKKFFNKENELIIESFSNLYEKLQKDSSTPINYYTFSMYLVKLSNTRQDDIISSFKLLDGFDEKEFFKTMKNLDPKGVEKFINNKKLLQEGGIKITELYSGIIKDLSKSDIENIITLKKEGLDLGLYSYNHIIGLTKQDINHIIDLKKGGVYLVSYEYKYVKGINSKDIERIITNNELLYKGGIKNNYLDDLINLSENDIENIITLKKEGINLYEYKYIIGLDKQDINYIIELKKRGINLFPNEYKYIKEINPNIETLLKLKKEGEKDGIYINLSKWVGIDINKYFKEEDFIKKSGDLSKIKEYRSKYMENKKNITSIINDVEDIISKNPKINLEDLLDQTLEKWGNFDLRTKLRILSKIKEYHTKVQKIDELLIKYKGKENELLKLVYGEKIKGEVTAERESSGLVFYISDEEDYAKLHSGKNSQKSGGFKAVGSNISELVGSIAFVKGKNKGTGSFSEEVKIHEARHTLNDIIFRGNDSSPLSRGKDEIIAYLSDGRSFEEIKKILTKEDGLYNYFEDQKGTIEYEKNWLKYKNKISQYIEEAKIIKELFPDDYINMLSVFNINEWKKLAKEATK